MRGPQKKLNIAAFWMGTKEVTHDEFLVFFGDESVTRNSDVDAVTRPTAQYIDLSWGMGKVGGFPFNSMSQRTALMYCRWLYKKQVFFTGCQQKLNGNTPAAQEQQRHTFWI